MTQADDLSWIDHPANIRANAVLLRAVADQSLLHAAEIEQLRENAHYAKGTAEAQEAAIRQAHAEIERLRAEVVRYRGILTSLKVEWHD